MQALGISPAGTWSPLSALCPLHVASCTGPAGAQQHTAVYFKHSDARRRVKVGEVLVLTLSLSLGQSSIWSLWGVNAAAGKVLETVCLWEKGDPPGTLLPPSAAAF